MAVSKGDDYDYLLKGSNTLCCDANNLHHFMCINHIISTYAKILI